MSTEKPLPLVISTSDNDNGHHELGRKLIDYNSSQFGTMTILPLLLSLRDGKGELRAGLSGKIFYQWLTIDLLWVADDLRGQGHGSALLKKAEKEARDRACTDAWVDTIGLRSLGFYEKNGYSVWGALPDYPPGHKRTFFRKSLRPTA